MLPMIILISFFYYDKTHSYTMNTQEYEKELAEILLKQEEFIADQLANTDPLIIHNHRQNINVQHEGVSGILLDYSLGVFNDHHSLGIYSFENQMVSFYFGNEIVYQETDYKSIESKIKRENRTDPFFYGSMSNTMYVVPLKLDNQQLVSGYVYTYYSNPVESRNTELFLLLIILSFLMALIGARWVNFKTLFKINQLNNEINNLKNTGKSIPISNDNFGVIARSVNNLTEVYESKDKINKAILDSLPLGVIFYGPDGSIECVNETAEKITGFSKEEIIAFTSRGQFLDKADRVFWETLRSGEKFLGFEGYCPTKYGIDIPVVTSTKEIIIDDVVIGRISSFIDVSEQTRLRKVEKRSKVMLDHISDGVITINNQEEITSFNVGAEEITGLKAENIKGKRYREIFDTEVSIYSILLETLRTGKEFKDEKREMVLENNRRLYFIVTTRLLRNDEGKLIGAMGIYKDITPMIELEQQILRAEKLAVIGELAAGTAHEIRNPLTTIQGFIQLLGDSLQDKNEKEYIMLIISEIGRINQIIKEMLLLAKPSAPSKKMTKIENLINETISFMNPEGSLHNVIVETRMSERIPELFIDEMQIKQVFINIIRNGIQAMKNGGILKVTVNYNLQENMVEIQFIDQGEGIPPAILKKIYDPFFTTKEEGTGLGIPISLQIMQNHEGDLKIESDIDHGTTVTVTFPI